MKSRFLQRCGEREPGVSRPCTLCWWDEQAQKNGFPHRLPFPSSDHLPTDVSIAYFTLLPKGVSNIVLTTIMPRHGNNLNVHWMDKEDVVHIYNGILLNRKKEWNNVICSNMDGPRDYRTKWSKPDRERQISCDITYMWNLKIWYKWTYLQHRNRPTDIENKLMVTKGGSEGRDELGIWE